MRASTKLLFILSIVVWIGWIGTTIAVSRGDAGVQTVSGRVVVVDARSASMSVRPETAALEPTTNVLLRIDGETKLMKSGLRIKLTDVRPGDSLTATFKMTTDANVALAVLIE